MLARAVELLTGRRGRSAERDEQRHAHRVAELPRPLRELVDGASVSVRERPDDDAAPRVVFVAEPAGIWQWRSREATANRLAQALPGFAATDYAAPPSPSKCWPRTPHARTPHPLRSPEGKGTAPAPWLTDF